MWLTRLALRNPVLILMMSLMTLALGFVSLRHLSVDLFPDITVPLIRVAVFYTGAGPTDIEKSITMPIERAVSASPGIDRVESTSKQGVSLVSAWFQFGTNLDNAQFDEVQDQPISLVVIADENEQVAEQQYLDEVNEECQLRKVLRHGVVGPL